MVIRSVPKLALVYALTASSLGCSVINAYEDPVVVGDWKLEINGQSRMTLELDGGGDARIQVAEPMGEIRYRLEWIQVDTDEFEIAFDCRSSPVGCEGGDFVMDCEASGSGNDLDCTARSGWQDPVFNWDRD